MGEQAIATQLSSTLYLGLENDIKVVRKDVAEIKLMVDNMDKRFDSMERNMERNMAEMKAMIASMQASLQALQGGLRPASRSRKSSAGHFNQASHPPITQHNNSSQPSFSSSSSNASASRTPTSQTSHSGVPSTASTHSCTSITNQNAPMRRASNQTFGQ